MKINNKQIKSLFLLSLVGSNLAKEEVNNQIEMNLNSLPQMATNFTKRGNETDPTLVYAGMPIFFGEYPPYRQNQTACMNGFLVVPSGSNEECVNEGNMSGFITSTSCCVDHDTCGIDSVFLATDNPFKIGNVQEATYEGWGDNIDFAFVSLNYAWDVLKTQPVPYVMGEHDLIPITGLGSATLGTKVCVFGVDSGYLCGNVVDINVSVNFDGLTKVDLGNHGLAINDVGSPVYTESEIGERNITQALGYVTFFGISDPNHQFMFYTPLEKVLDGLASEDCNYVLLTYNETNAQEYNNLLAQVEIPTKK